MGDQGFTQRAAAALDRLESAIEGAAERAGVDLELSRSDNLIEVEFDDGSKIVINSHEAAGEIWVASRAGGFHFRPQADGRWLDGRSGGTLATLLTAQLSLQAGTPVDLGELPL
jgi:CyaY protein